MIKSCSNLVEIFLLKQGKNLKGLIWGAKLDAMRHRAEPGPAGENMETDLFGPKNLNDKSPLSGPISVNKQKNSANRDIDQRKTNKHDDQQSAKNSTSIIHFPHDRSAGDLYLLEEKGKTKFLGQALGEIHLPEGAGVFLYYDYDQVYGCSRLARLASDALHGLSFLGTEISDSDLQFLKHLHSLQALDVSCTSLTNNCLQYLQALPNLRSLNLSSTKITSKSAQSLYRFNNLIELILDNTVIGDQSVVRLSSLPKLEILSVSFTEVTSRGLAKVKSLKNLKKLRLNSTKVSNAAIDFLVSLSELEELWLTGTRITHSGLTELKKRLPNCHMVY